MDLLQNKMMKMLKEGAFVHSSGTTGESKAVYRTAENLQSCIDVALRVQKITKKSSIYTVTKLIHAGGLLAQTLPALSIGANVLISDFKIYQYLDELRNHSHSFLTPEHMRALMKTKSFKNYDFGKKTILTGSSAVGWDLIEAFVERGAIVQPNWGMSEIGPIVINSTFENIDQVKMLKEKTPAETTIMGNEFHTDYKVDEGELFVRGDMCVYSGWFATGDLVQDVGGVLFYKGRRKV